MHNIEIPHKNKSLSLFHINACSLNKNIYKEMNWNLLLLKLSTRRNQTLYWAALQINIIPLPVTMNRKIKEPPVTFVNKG